MHKPQRIIHNLPFLFFLVCILFSVCFYGMCLFSEAVQVAHASSSNKWSSQALIQMHAGHG
jgi:hypothetical protein